MKERPIIFNSETIQRAIEELEGAYYDLTQHDEQLWSLIEDLKDLKVAEWKKIEEAPKDGTRILVTNSKYGGIYLAQWMPDRVMPEGYISPLKSGFFHTTGSRIPNDEDLTHFQELPAPPVTKGKHDA